MRGLIFGRIKNEIQNKNLIGIIFESRFSYANQGFDEINVHWTYCFVQWLLLDPNENPYGNAPNAVGRIQNRQVKRILRETRNHIDEVAIIDRKAFNFFV